MTHTHLLVIDPQNDFTHPDGSLHVPGADKDMQRLAAFLGRSLDLIDDIHVTLDSHREVDIAHPVFWLDPSGNPPAPFTTITLDDLDKGRWQPRLSNQLNRVRDYLRELANNGRYDLTIWPPHCIIGSWGHSLDVDFSNRLREWERRRFGTVNYVTKGSNIWTEHYSAVVAEVPDPSDPTTQLNTSLIDVLQDPNVSRILIAGEALSHCVANTIRDIGNHFGSENIRKFTLLQDCSSSVPGFEKLGEDFITEMCAKGMTLAKSTELDLAATRLSRAC